MILVGPMINGSVHKTKSLPPKIVKTTCRSIFTVFSEPTHQAWLLSEHLGPSEKKLRVIDVRGMFVQMRDQA